MNANEFTFGIEIETIAPNSAVQNDGLRIGPYKRGIQVPYLPAGWKAEADGSIAVHAGLGDLATFRARDMVVAPDGDAYAPPAVGLEHFRPS